MERGTAVMETPERGRVFKSEADSGVATARRSRAASGRAYNTRPGDTGPDDMGSGGAFEDEDYDPGQSAARRSRGVRSEVGQRLFGWMPVRVPQTTWGRVAAGFAAVLVVGSVVAVVLAGRRFFVHDERFVVPSASAIEITGNAHLARAEVLSVFGGDIERNIFNVSLKDRREALEALPWVEHATVMRLLPDHLRVAITERTPVAFVRQGSAVGLVDAGGVLLTMPVNAPGDPAYSFPVVTGLNAADPLSTRAARMKLYERFTGDLDSTGEHISNKLSEVDLSDPEDVKALIPEGATDVLVHFGESDFLARYERFVSLLPEWKTQYPKLASVDMRYERQVVLEMQPGAATTAAAGAVAGAAAAGAAASAASKVLPVAAAAAVSHGSAPAPIAAPVGAAGSAAASPAALSGQRGAAVRSGSSDRPDKSDKSDKSTVAGSTASSAQVDRGGAGVSSAAAHRAAAKKAVAKRPVAKKPWVSQWRLAHPNAPPLPAGWKPGMPSSAAANVKAARTSNSLKSTSVAPVSGTAAGRSAATAPTAGVQR